MSIIPTLREEHVEILKMFNQIDATDLFEEKKEKINELKGFVIKHVITENEDIYPILEKSQTPDSVKLGKVMSSLMQSYSVDFIAAIDAILMGGSSSEKQMIDAFNESVIDIKNRIKIEELLLFPEYEKVLLENSN